MDKGVNKNQKIKQEHSLNLTSGRVEYELELLQRHLMMLNIIVNHEPIGIIRLSNLSNFPQHKVRYSLRILEQEGLIRPSADGAITTKKFKSFISNLNNQLINLQKSLKEIKTSVQQKGK